MPHSKIDDKGRDVRCGSGTDGYGNSMRSELSSRVDGHGESREVLPLFLALHCLGCQGSQMMHFSEVSEAYSFVLTTPEGIQTGMQNTAVATPSGITLTILASSAKLFKPQKIYHP